MVAGEHVLLVKGLQLLEDITITMKNTIRDAGSTALCVIYTVDAPTRRAKVGIF